MGYQPLPSKQRTVLMSPSSNASETSTRAPSLATSLRATMSSPQKRRVVIPGSSKRSRAAQSPVAVARMLGPRLRTGIVLTTLLLLLAIALVSFVPLGTGQGSFTLFTGVSDWVQANQVDWSVQAHVAPTAPVAVPTVTFGPVTMTLPKSQYVAIAEQDATAAGIPATYFVRQINLESGFNPNAHSSSGAEGIAQFMPATAAGLGINPWDPIASLQAAAHLMASYAKAFGGDYAKALAAYNSGSATVNSVVSTCGTNWMSCLPAQTQRYIAIIMGG
jgi:Transglycosylase SLT domain